MRMRRQPSLALPAPACLMTPIAVEMSSGPNTGRGASAGTVVASAEDTGCTRIAAWAGAALRATSPHVNKAVRYETRGR